MPSYRTLNSDSFGVKIIVIGQVEQELWFCKEFIIGIDEILSKLRNLASLRWNIWKTNPETGLQKNAAFYLY